MEKVKILGVKLDSSLRLNQHIVNASNKGLRAVLALKRLTSIPPSVSRQMFVSTVYPVVVDDAPVLWEQQVTANFVPRLGQNPTVGGSVYYWSISISGPNICRIRSRNCSLDQKKRCNFGLKYKTVPVTNSLGRISTKMFSLSFSSLTKKLPRSNPA